MIVCIIDCCRILGEHRQGGGLCWNICILLNIGMDAYHMKYCIIQDEGEEETEVWTFSENWKVINKKKCLEFNICFAYINIREVLI